MRIEQWATALNNEIDKARQTDFEWGQRDCALFVADCILAMTGVDFGAPFRGHYQTAKGSLIALKKYGKGSLKKTMDADFKRHSALAMARRGDAVLIENESGPCLGICVGQQAVFRTPETDVTFIPMTDCLLAWAID